MSSYCTTSAPTPAFAHVPFDVGDGVVLRPPPQHGGLRIQPGLPHQSEWRVEHAGDGEFAVHCLLTQLNIHCTPNLSVRLP